MASRLNFGSALTITYVGTATALLEIEGVMLLTDPYFSPAETSWPVAPGVSLMNHYTPSHNLSTLPPIDAILLSHEDHPDNLDENGRRLLYGRRVLTTVDGAQKLALGPGVTGLKPWDTVTLNVCGKRFEVTGTPCQHLPGGECTGFVITAHDFGTTDGLPNAMYFSGDTVYIEDLARIKDRFHVTVALLNIGAAMAVPPGMTEPLLITMDGEEATKLFRDLGADILIPMHFESWDHFTEGKDDLIEVFRDEGISDYVRWLTPGVATKVV
ncbi:putative Metallo-beta-lactamase domain-containing protein [Seiridium cardinale]|uniref:Metallo-beta-lactamase domain-containing protein n=1 Tax=Seiridium cardinale TaxID=138064 RepID=A0ABR2XW49_9PEZI